jgi:hypothetical protein
MEDSCAGQGRIDEAEALLRKSVPESDEACLHILFEEMSCSITKTIYFMSYRI